MTRVLLVLALAATLIAAWFAPEGADNGVELSTRVMAMPSTMVQIPAMARESDRRKRDSTVDVLQIRPRGEVDEEGARLFAPISWTPHPPKAEPVPVETINTTQAVESTEIPTVPLLPFVALGRYEDRGRSLVFLQYMDQNLAVAVGDTIADSYRAEKIEGNTLMLRHLPSGELQTLDVGGIQ